MDTLLTIFTFGVIRFFIVEQGTVRLLTEFGKYISTYQSGLHWCLSFWGLYKRPGPAIPILEQIAPYNQEVVFTSDGVKCLIDVVIWYKVIDPYKAQFEVEDYKMAVRNAVQSILRNECGKQPTRMLLSGREQILTNLKATLEHDAAPWGISVRLVEIKNIDIRVQEKGGGL